MNESITITNFNKLYNDYYQQFVYFALDYVRDEIKAKDFISDAYASCWKL